MIFLSGKIWMPEKSIGFNIEHKYTTIALLWPYKKYKNWGTIAFYFLPITSYEDDNHHKVFPSNCDT